MSVTQKRSTLSCIATIAAVLALFVLPSVADAAPVVYRVDSAPHATGTSKFTFDNGNLTAVSMTLYATQCAPGMGTPSTGHAYTVTLSGGPVALSSGSFTATGTAPSAYYPGSGTADFSISGQMSPDGRSISGTATLTNATDPFITNCTGTFQLLALPDAGAVTNTWTIPQDRTLVGSKISFDYAASTLSNLTVQPNFSCGTSVNAAEIIANYYNVTSIPVDGSGNFSLHMYAFDEYQYVVILDLTGHTDGASASGTWTISEPAGFHGIGGAACSGTSSWTANVPGSSGGSGGSGGSVTPTPTTPTSPTVPTAPTSPTSPLPPTLPAPAAPTGPYATFVWNAVRIPIDPVNYEYHFYVTKLKCYNKATEVRVKVGGRGVKISCKKNQGWASVPLAAGTAYNAAVQAFRLRGKKVVKRGPIVRGQPVMPAPDSYWIPISGLPGTPPH